MYAHAVQLSSEDRESEARIRADERERIAQLIESHSRDQIVLMLGGGHRVTWGGVCAVEAIQKCWAAANSHCSCPIPPKRNRSRIEARHLSPLAPGSASNTHAAMSMYCSISLSSRQQKNNRRNCGRVSMVLPLILSMNPQFSSLSPR
jgi:hypothetical protein